MPFVVLIQLVAAVWPPNVFVPKQFGTCHTLPDVNDFSRSLKTCIISKFGISLGAMRMSNSYFVYVTWTKARNVHPCVQNQHMLHMFLLISNPAGGNMTSTNAAKDWMSVVPLPFVVCQAKTVPIIEI